MNRTLIEIVAHLALWLEFADESIVDLDAAVKQQEDLAHRLQQLTDAERAEFVRVLRDLADANPRPEERRFLHELPEIVGIA